VEDVTILGPDKLKQPSRQREERTDRQTDGQKQWSRLSDKLSPYNLLLTVVVL